MNNIEKKVLKEQLEKILKSAESGNLKATRILLDIKCFKTQKEKAKNRLKTGMVINANNLKDDSRELVTGDVINWE